MALRVYTYKNCGTCRNAVKFLNARGVKFAEVPIREQAPTIRELQRMLAHYDGEIRKLFNTSGQDYRALGLGPKLDVMGEDEALGLLAANGNLVKRPFVVAKEGGLVGFKPEEWERLVR